MPVSTPLGLALGERRTLVRIIGLAVLFALVVGALAAEAGYGQGAIRGAGYGYGYDGAGGARDDGTPPELFVGVVSGTRKAVRAPVVVRRLRRRPLRAAAVDGRVVLTVVVEVEDGMATPPSASLAS